MTHRRTKAAYFFFYRFSFAPTATLSPTRLSRNGLCSRMCKLKRFFLGRQNKSAKGNRACRESPMAKGFIFPASRRIDLDQLHIFGGRGVGALNVSNKPTRREQSSAVVMVIIQRWWNEAGEILGLLCTGANWLLSCVLTALEFTSRCCESPAAGGTCILVQRRTFPR